MDLYSYKELKNHLYEFALDNDVLSAYFVRVNRNNLHYIIYNDYTGDADIGLNTQTFYSLFTNPWIREALEGNSVGSELGNNSLGSESRMTAFSPVFDNPVNPERIIALAGVDIDDSSIVQARRMVSLLTIVQIIVVILVFITGLLNILRLFHEADKAQAANLAKSNFLSRMSHEIRTPLNAIIGMGELALNSETMPKVLEYVKGIKQAGQNLFSLINDILDFSKIETGGLQIIQAPYSIASLLNDVINVIQIRLTEKPVIFTVDVDPHLPARLMGDELRIRQILFNLLSNATKYTQQGVINLKVVMGTRSEENENPPLIITVTDTGIGIKKEDLANLFGNFVRFDMVKNKSIEGSGLGLAITRSLCRAMGGDITVTSEYEKGSVFIATIPQGIINYDKLAVVENPRANIVLLYDHRLEYVKSLKETLKGLGVTIIVAANEEDFFKKLSSGGFSFVFISDIILEKTRAIIKKEFPCTVLVLLSDIGKVAASDNVIVIPMPAYAVPVANVINGKGYVLAEKKEADSGFITPEAKLLLVDDIPANLVVAEGLLSPYKARIDSCSSGARALELVKTRHYDLVFMDHMMPEMDGIETVRNIRQWEKDNAKKGISIVALTANAISGMREMFLEEGFNDYLSKPIDTFRLNEIMKNWIPADKQKQKEKEEKPEENIDLISGIVINGINLQEGQERYKGKLYFEVLRAWCLHTPVLLDKLKQLRQKLADGSFSEQVTSEYTITVHGLKGSTYGICAPGAGKKAEDLEAAIRRNDIEFVTTNTGPLIEETSALLHDLDKLLSGFAAEQANSKPLSISPDIELLTQLYSAGKQYKSSQMELILNELEERQYETGGDLVLWLREQIDNLEYEAICDRLKKELNITE